MTVEKSERSSNYEITFKCDFEQLIELLINTHTHIYSTRFRTSKAFVPAAHFSVARTTQCFQLLTSLPTFN